MISHISYVFENMDALDLELSHGRLAESAEAARSILVQVYCAETDPAHIRAVTECIRKRLPQSVVVGATTAGEIAHGRLLSNSTIIGFTFFGSSGLTAFALPCEPQTDREVGAELGRLIHECADRVAGVLLLATPLNIDAAALLAGLDSAALGVPVFGGGAGDLAVTKNAMVFTDTAMFGRGAIAVALTGEDLHVEVQTYLGWLPLSKPMRITQVDGVLVKRIDDVPAFKIYEHYLGIPKDKNFATNALEFPMLLERDDKLVARIPAGITSEGDLQMISDVKEGETFRMGYGNPDLIIEEAKQVHRALTDVGSQVNFLYSCCCRHFLMQQDVELETLPFESNAPTFGFYTFGEFFGVERLTLLNATMVAVGLREGAAPAAALAEETGTPVQVPTTSDPRANKHTRIVTRLMHFIEAVTSDLETAKSNLEAANREITRLSLTDPLTQLPNRARLDQALFDAMERALRYGDDFSVVLFDIDYFKQVNDTFGHLVGDSVLVEMGQILTHQTRSTDVAGRWGGEEFLIVAPQTPLDEAEKLAERLRSSIAGKDFVTVGHKTISAGVATYSPGDDLDKLLGRADVALYQAKRSGRDRVEVAVSPVSTARSLHLIAG
jgi:diguanylate cyclase (GGDEF)-like protein